MFHKFILAAAITCIASTTYAKEITYDQNEALSPEVIAKIWEVYNTDFANDGPVQVVRFEGDTEAFSPAQVDLIKAAFAAAN